MQQHEWKLCGKQKAKHKRVLWHDSILHEVPKEEKAIEVELGLPL